jgi:hypothetical protein
VLSLFAATAWLAMKSSVIETVDRDLRARIIDVGDFIRKEIAVSRSQLDEEFGEHALLGMGGGLVQVIDANGHILFRSARFGADQLLSANVPPNSSGIAFLTSGSGRAKLRVASQTIAENGQAFTIQVAELLHEFDEASEVSGMFFWLSAPFSSFSRV